MSDQTDIASGASAKNAGETAGSSDLPEVVNSTTADDEEKSVEEQLTQAVAEAAKWQESAQRHKADFINYQNRMKREREQLREFALRSFVEMLLPTLDNFRLSLKSAMDDNKSETTGPVFDSLLEAMKLVENSLRQTLIAQGLEIIAQASVAFDPEIHEAVAHVPHPDAFHGSVLEVARTGYRWHGKVLRPAQVIVVDNPENPAPAQEKTEGGPDATE